MINITKGQSNTVFLTLSEMQTSPSSYYYILFTNRATKTEKILYLTNISTKSSYQKFTINGSSFEGADTGLWSYEARESNIDEDIIGGVLEAGYMDLKNASSFQPSSYNEQLNTYKTYNG